MKTKHFLMAFISACLFSTTYALEHGSLIIKNASLYEQRNGAAPGAAKTETISFKLVTIDSKSWAWTEIQGANIMGKLGHHSYAGGKDKCN